MALQLWPKIEQVAHDLSGLIEDPIGSNDGITLRRGLKHTRFSLGAEWCGFWAQAVWYGADVDADKPDTEKWWLDEGSAHLTLAEAKKRGKVLSGPASGAMFLLCHADGTPFHYGICMGLDADEPGNIKSMEGNTNLSGSPTGYRVCEHSRPIDRCIFIQP